MKTKCIAMPTAEFYPALLSEFNEAFSACVAYVAEKFQSQHDQIGDGGYISIEILYPTNIRFTEIEGWFESWRGAA